MEGSISDSVPSPLTQSVVYEAPAGTKLNAVCAWTGGVVVGCADGTVLHFSHGSAAVAAVVSAQARSPAGAVSQLAAAEACGVVVLLHADGSLALRTLPSLEAGVAPAQPGGDCAAIAVLPASDPDGVRLAACTAGARLRVYRWRQATFAPMCEAALAEPVRWMAWASAASLWLGQRHRYSRLVIPTLEQRELLPATTGAQAAPVGCALDVGTGAEMLLLTQETLGVFVAEDGTPSRAFSPTFAAAPRALVGVGGAYVLALDARGVELHLLLDTAATPLQLLPLCDATAVAVSRGRTDAAQAPPPAYALAPDRLVQLTAAPLPALAMVLASRSSAQLASLLARAEVLPALRRAARHEEALQLLARLAQAEPAEEAARLGDGARDVVAYAASLGAEHRDLAERSASWLLQRDPRAVVPLYLAAAADADALQSLHPEHVLRLLRENAPAARQLQVLTHLLEKLPADDPALGASAGAGGSAAAPPPRELLVRELVQLHLAELVRLAADDSDRGDAGGEDGGGDRGSGGGGGGSDDEARVAELRGSLLLLLETEGRPANALLTAVERACASRPALEIPLAQHRALLLTRTGRSVDALWLLARELQDPALALAHCARHAAEGAHLGELLGVYLRPAAGAAPLLAPALELINTHHDRVDGDVALALLPDDVTVAQLQPALAALLFDVGHRSRNALVTRNLQKTKSVRMRAALLDVRARRVIVADDTECAACGKRIGLAAFAVLPQAAAGDPSDSSRVKHVGCVAASTSQAVVDSPRG